MTDINQMKERIKSLEAALKPFADCVYNDNGDVMISSTHLKALHYMQADAALHNFRGSSTRRMKGRAR